MVSRITGMFVVLAPRSKMHRFAMPVPTTPKDLKLLSSGMPKDSDFFLAAIQSAIIKEQILNPSVYPSELTDKSGGEAK